MELVYLWVEEYKNIKKEGFNFSPRFRCIFYDEYEKDENGNEKLKDGCELVIENKEDEYVSIFPDNINVTAIVGENGSGKSNLIDLILKITENKSDEIKYIIIYKNTYKKLICNSNVQLGIDIDENIIIKNIIVYNKSEHVYHPFRNYRTVETDKKSIAKMLITDISEESMKFQISTFMYRPVKMKISIKEDTQLIEESINFVSNIKKRKKIENLFINNISDNYHKLLFLCYIRVERSPNTKILANKQKLEEEVENIINEKKFNKYFLQLINQKTFTIANLSSNEKKYYIKKGGYNYFLDFDFEDEKERKFNNLSHGEQMIFAQLFNIYFYLQSQASFLLMFDEPEIALHPNWQKKYMNEVIILLKNLKKEGQFLFTSHSPFLLSDLPKENVIFLENGKQVYPEIETFGANIHTLLSHGFFMKGGLMGEFAKGKINEAIKKLNKPKLNEEDIKFCENIISIIGEPILKRQMQKMLDSKRLTKIDDINKKIRDMAYELEILKEHQSKVVQDDLKDKGKKKYKQSLEDD